jgi:hypothetical protein
VRKIPNFKTPKAKQTLMAKAETPGFVSGISLAFGGLAFEI